jgi:hypothetical protein
LVRGHARSPELKALLYAKGIDFWKSLLARLAEGVPRTPYPVPPPTPPWP